MANNKLSNAQDLDDLLEVVGAFGRYQKRMMLLVFMPASFFIAFTMNLLLFQMVVPDHWCHAPGRENTTLTLDEWHRVMRPKSNNSSKKLSNCLMYEIDFGSSSDNVSMYTGSNTTRECVDGWEFDTTQFAATVATTLGWVCEYGHYSHYTLSTSMAGNAVGTLILPILADRYAGRRAMFFLDLALHIVFTIPLIWVTGALLHMVLRFFQGLSFQTNYLMPYTIYMEVIPPERRALAVMLSFLAWTFGMCFTALVAWMIPQWQYLAIISIIPSLLGFLLWRLLPESPRWLLAKGKVRQCANVFLQIGKVNGVQQVSQAEMEAQVRALMKQQPVNQPLTTILAYPKLTLRALMLLLICFMQFVVYGVTMLSMTVMSNSFLAHFVLSIFELPSNFIGCLVTHYLGRRFMAYSNYLLLAIFCFAAPFCAQSEWLLMTIVGFAKLFSTSSLYIIYLMSSEVFPTPIRTSGTGITVVFGMFGMVVAPHVLHSGLGEAGHYWILMALTILSAVCMIPLPETLGLPLPQTFQEAEELGQGRPFTSWVHHWSLHKYPPPPPPPSSEQSYQQESFNAELKEVMLKPI